MVRVWWRTQFGARNTLQLQPGHNWSTIVPMYTSKTEWDCDSNKESKCARLWIFQYSANYLLTYLHGWWVHNLRNCGASLLWAGAPSHFLVRLRGLFPTISLYIKQYTHNIQLPWNANRISYVISRVAPIPCPWVTFTVASAIITFNYTIYYDAMPTNRKSYSGCYFHS